ncbi:MAG TPA: thiamine-phosphate kinase [Eoetvoesiella sp.]|uniref:thiamine-phosphate kinase n=1 Tax=Eoetvoesiella sp. TaxID=1966355 RepID=UPI002C92591D|nr:thiamine-phosphate kinase [Eoetvoesiella sp.]HWK62079.1 thiamine-phosphate kinase [Eoetvoesiella sp.]
MAHEFDLIARHFSRPVPARFLGVGDDCALLPVDAGRQMAVSTDLLIEGRHFFAGVDPGALGHKALAVNLSDLAAMGAQPLACVLGLALPAVDHDWLGAFADGFYAMADRASCPLVGGDTTRSVSGITLSVTVFGQVDPVRALRRSAAQAGDDIWITGSLGSADIALKLLQQALPFDASLLAATRDALERPEPPLFFAQDLAGVAHAALDISDGLLQDLGHILAASHCGAELDYDSLPVHQALRGLPAAVQEAAVLGGGDVYELCFTAAADRRETVLALARRAGVRATRIGRITQGGDMIVRRADGGVVAVPSGGFDHFG